MDSKLSAIKEEIINKLTEKEIGFKGNFTQENRVGLQRAVEAAFRAVVKESKINLNRQESDELLGEIISFFIGFGPIENLLKDQEITEIMINGPQQVYIERKGNLELTDIVF